MYCEITAREKTAPIALGPPKDKKPRRRATISANHTHRTGAYTRRLTLYSQVEKTNPPSREKANICLDVAVSYGVQMRTECRLGKQGVNTHEA